MSTKTSQSPKPAIGAGPRKRQNQKPQSDILQLDPETAELLAKLKGDEETVRGAIVSAGNTNAMLGFRALVAACYLVKDVEFRKELIEILGSFGHYQELRQDIAGALWDLAGRETSPEVFGAIDRAFDSFKPTPREVVTGIGIEIPAELEDALLTREDLGLPTTGLSSDSNVQQPVDPGQRLEEAVAVQQSKGKPSVYERWRKVQSEPETGAKSRRGRWSKTSKKSAAASTSATPTSDDTPASGANAGSLNTNLESSQPEQIQVGAPQDD